MLFLKKLVIFFLCSLFLCISFCTVFTVPLAKFIKIFKKHDQCSHLGKTIDHDALILVITFDMLLIKFMQTAQLTSNGGIGTEFFAVLFLFNAVKRTKTLQNISDT